MRRALQAQGRSFTLAGRVDSLSPHAGAEVVFCERRVSEDSLIFLSKGGGRGGGEQVLDVSYAEVGFGSRLKDA